MTQLLFNKVPADFPAEFKSALGFVDADFKFNKLRADLRTTTNELVKIIGQEVYDEIYGWYIGAPDPDQTAMVEAAQYAVASGAYKLYAPINDLQHGVNGRKMLTSEDSKTPFEHMLVASDDELERRYFRAIDDLLELLDVASATWKASVEYKESHKNIVRTVDEFNEYWTMNSRLLLIKLSPGIAKAERQEIAPRIGSEAYQALKDKRDATDQTALTALQAVLLPLIQEACVYYSLSWGVPRFQATLFPEGILQPVRTDRQTVKGRVGYTGNQVDQAAQLFKRDAEDVFLEIERILKAQEVVDEEEDQESTAIDVCKLTGFESDSAFVST